jgi:hypothetical protein
MSIVEIIKRGLDIARTHRSLWLFAFVVGLSVGGGNGGGGGGAGQGGGGPGPGFPLAALAVPLVIGVLVAIVIKFVSEGALIEGVSRAYHGGSQTIGEGFRAGWAHWGVLLRIAVIYFVASVGSIAALAAPCFAASEWLGRGALILVGIPAVLVAVPWLVTLYVLRALAARIAVLENRRALDAIAEARLFLHGRIRHGLRLMVAAFAGPLAVTFAGIVAIAPLVLLCIAVFRLAGAAPAVLLGIVTLLPAFFVAVAFIGTVQSATWTLGYLAQTDR